MTSRTNTIAAPAARRIALAAAAAFALSLAATSGFAQTASTTAPVHWGAGFHGRHGGAGIDMMPRVLEQIKASLNLNTSQQVMWDNAVAQGTAARDAAIANRKTVRDALQAELAKAEPDLAAVATAADGVAQQNRTLHKQVRDQWLALYATFSPEQKAIVRDALQARLAKAESFRQRMRAHFGATGS
jgi:Spy/CpxP family protein refolding chaperone